MKIQNLIADSDSRPLRFAVILSVMIVVILLASKSQGQENAGPANWSTSWSESIRQAEDQNAPIMLLFAGSDWCPWTEKLNAEVFRSDEFANWADGRLVPVLVDFPRRQALPANLTTQNNNLLNRYRQHLNGFPTVLFVRPDGTVIGKLGFEPGGLNVWIQKAQKIIGVLDKVAGNIVRVKSLAIAG